MANGKYKHLFQPIVLGKQVFRNRIFNSPTGIPEFPIQDCIHYYERKALGGAASVCIGDACPSLDGMSRPSHINLWDESSRLDLLDVAYAINPRRRSSSALKISPGPPPTPKVAATAWSRSMVVTDG